MAQNDWLARGKKLRLTGLYMLRRSSGSGYEKPQSS
jgi:hypothetical protein